MLSANLVIPRYRQQAKLTTSQARKKKVLTLRAWVQMDSDHQSSHFLPVMERQARRDNQSHYAPQVSRETSQKKKDSFAPFACCTNPALVGISTAGPTSITVMVLCAPSLGRHGDHFT